VNFAIFRYTLTCVGGLSTAVGAIVVAGRISVFLAFGLIAVTIGLTAVLALIGVFGREDRRNAAQAVLTILLDRNKSRTDWPELPVPDRARLGHLRKHSRRA
jgi:hypothetical protein